jgi:hypothetical protein
VTRLRLEDPEFIPKFCVARVAAVEQAMSTDGNLAAQVLPAENGGYWTCTGWLEHSALQDVVRREPHLDLMAPVDDGCDEATFGDG